MRWLALLHSPTDDPASPTDAAPQALALWALQFTPRVAIAEEAVLMEVGASLRLFGGWPALCERVRAEAQTLGVARLAWAPNGLAALALARAGVEDGLARPLPPLLDALPLDSLSATRPHQAMLARIGCRCLGDLRRLPRAGLGRRFGAPLLGALDRLYGQAPETHAWVSVPERFAQRLELPFRVDAAPALMAGAQHLLLALRGWLAARHSGVLALTLSWAHDALRSRQAGEGGELGLRVGEPTRDIGHLGRLLAEHLARVTLQAPVGDLALRADEVRPLAPSSACLLPETVPAGEALRPVLERLAARLGPQRVLRPVLVPDHRPEAMCRWQPALQPLAPQAAPPAPPATLPQPGFLLAQPLRLLMRGHHPVYQGVLQLLVGPQRIEGGWWDRDGGAEAATRALARDYWVARSEQAGLLWVFQTRLDDTPAWFLHGYFS